MQKSDSNALIDGVAIRPVWNSAELNAAMSAAIVKGDLEATRSLVREAQTEHPGDPTLAASVLKCKTLLSRAKLLDEALEAMQSEFSEDHFSAALGHFREALCLCRGFPALKAVADAQADEQSKRLLPHNWRVAEVLLQEAVATEPFFIPDADLQRQFQLARHEETIASAIHKADRAEFDGTLEEARRRLKELLAAFPDETRLAERLRTLDRRPGSSSASGSATSRPESRSAAALTVYNSGQVVAAKSRPLAASIAKPSWDKVKSFASLAATSAMLGVAGFLIWQHVSSTSQKSKDTIRTERAAVPAAPFTDSKPILPPAAPSQLPQLNAAAVPVVASRDLAEPAEEQAWQLVRSSDDENSLRAFLTAYPSSPHIFRARLRLAAIQWSKVDKSNVASLQTYLRLHSRSPYRAEAEQLIQDLIASSAPPAASNAPVSASDREAILEAVRAYLDEQPESDQQSSSDVIDEPVIDGEQATIQLHLKGSVTTPALTFSLVKTAGVWKVQSAR